MMPVPKKPLKLYMIEVTEGGSTGSTTYFATGEDAFDAYSDVAIHEDSEGHHTHQESYSASVEATEVDLEALPKFIAWKCA
jgi:hypothetical protein